MKLSRELNDAVQVLRNAELDSSQGLTEELFWMISALVPIVNVDLLIVNEKGQLLLARRNDAFYEKSWHIPGGCLRYGENLNVRVQRTAIHELGCRVEFNPEPIAIRNVLRGENERQIHPRERGHNVAILYRCQLPENYQIDNGDKIMTDDGYLQWFDALPDDFMKIQTVYDDILAPWKRQQNNAEYI